MMATIVAGWTVPLSIAAASAAVSLGPAVARRSTRGRRAISSGLSCVAALAFPATAQNDGGGQPPRDHPERTASGDRPPPVNPRPRHLWGPAIPPDRPPL